MYSSTKLQKNHLIQEKTSKYPAQRCSVAVLQFSKGYLHTQEIVLYLYIYKYIYKYRVIVCFGIICFLTATLQRCNTQHVQQLVFTCMR